MDNSIHLIKLAYLIEISVVLNLTYREIKYSQTGAKLLSSLDKVMNDLSVKEIDIDRDNFYEPEYGYLVNIYEGNDKESWQNHNSLRKFYRKFLKNGLSINIVTYCLLYNILFLSIITLFDYIFISAQVKNFVWIIGYASLNITIITPLLFMWGSSICYRYLFGDRNTQDTGRVPSLEYKICKKFKDWQSRNKELAERRNVLPESEQNGTATVAKPTEQIA